MRGCKNGYKVNVSSFDVGSRNEGEFSGASIQLSLMNAHSQPRPYKRLIDPHPLDAVILAIISELVK